MNFIAEQLISLSEEFDNAHINDTYSHYDIWEKMLSILSFDETQTIEYLKNITNIEVLQNISCVLPDVSFQLQSVEYVQAVKELYAKFSIYLDANLVLYCEESLFDPVKEANMLKIWRKHKKVPWWQKRGELLAKQNEQFVFKIATLQKKIQQREFTFTEQIELKFLQKIQAADDLETLQNIVAEIEQTPTTDEVKICLLQDVEEKKAFY